MKDIDDYSGVEEMEERIIELMRANSMGEELPDEPGVFEMQDLCEVVMVTRMVQRGFDVDRACDLVGQARDIHIEVTKQGILNITFNLNDTGLDISMED